MVFHEEWMKQTIISFKDTFNDHFVQGRVSNVDFEHKKVFLQDSEQVIEYTDIVFAVGSDGPFPGRPESTSMAVIKIIKVQLFWEGNKNFSPPPYGFDVPK